MHWVRRVLLAIAIVVGAGCGSSLPTSSPRAAAEQRYEADITILENATHGPQLCFNVAASYPPQCGGPDLRNFSWSDVHPQKANGVTWVEAHVVGTWADGALTLTEPPGAARHQPTPEQDLTAPCPPPSGGWRVVNPAKASQADL